jgi:N-acetylglutamate synthase
MRSAAEICLLDALAADAWPAPVIEEVDGWRLRWGHGFTGRANSVWARREGRALSLDEKIAAAEGFYMGLGGRPMFQLSPASRPGSLDRELEQRGYERGQATSVEVAPTAEVWANTAGAVWPLRIDARPDQTWLETWLGVRGFGDAMVAEQIVCGTEAKTAYAQIDGVGVGRVALAHGWAGIFAMATVPHARRQGAARAILHSLAGWALGHGSGAMYLQVEESNGAARALYASAGFVQRYVYHYRTLST